MSIFDNNLGIIGLGVEGDVPGPGTETVLPDGIHLRWQFKHERGFPWHGYYLLRRPSASAWKQAFDFKRTFRDPNDPKTGNALQRLLNSFSDENESAVYIPLSHSYAPAVVVGAEGSKAKNFFKKVGTATEPLQAGPVTINSMIHGNELDDFPLLTGQLQKEGANQYDLYGLSLRETTSLQLQSPPPHHYRRVRLRIGFFQAGTTTVLALDAGQTVLQQSVTGHAGSIETIILSSDDRPFSVLTFSRTEAVVLDFEYVFALGSEKWELVPFNTLKDSQPIRLPITHPDYPAGQGIENSRRARDLAGVRSFVTGQSFPWRVTAQNVASQGTVTVMPNSPFVRGVGTGWDDSIEGHVLETARDGIPHIIMRVLSTELLVLARTYNGSWHNQTSYSVNPDPFGQLYDVLNLLVEGGPAAAPMANRFLRPNYHPGGTAHIESDNTLVIGQGTNWSSALVDMHIHFLLDRGELRFTPGSNLVEGMGTAWGSQFSPVGRPWFSGLAGSILEIAGHPRPYVVTHIVGEEFLRIYPPVANSEHDGDKSSQTAGFRILERHPYRIKEVNTETSLHLDSSYRGRVHETGFHETEYILQIPKIRKKTASKKGNVEVQIPDQRLLDVIALGGVSPMIAQALGLQVVDRPPKMDASGASLAYDYLLIADHDGFFHSKSDVAPWVNSELGKMWLLGNTSAWPNLDDPNLDAAITYDHRIEQASSPAPPEAPRAYCLGDAARLLPRVRQPDQTPLKALAGLTWNNSSQARPSEAPALYHVWSQFLGDGDRPTLSEPDDPANYSQLTRVPPGGTGPVIIAQSDSTSDLPNKPLDWPHDLRYLDMVSGYGWYSYRISSVDVFGRHSPLSEAAPWWRHGSYMRGQPPIVLHPFAAHIVDKTTPPPPTGVEAQVLDPADSYIQRNSALTTWRNALPEDQRDTLLGLRVRWRWTQGQMQQAPDTTHFQICYHPHRLNFLMGRIVQVDADGSDHVFITTDITISASPSDLNEAYLRVGQHNYRIVHSYQARSDPFSIRIAMLGPDRLRPRVGQSFALAPTQKLGRRLYTDYSDPAAWNDADVHRVSIDAFAGEELKTLLDGTSSSAHGSFLTLPVGVDLSYVRPGFDHIYLPEAEGRKYVRIAQILPPQQPGYGPQLWLAEAPQLHGLSTRWAIGAYERYYEVLLPKASNVAAFNLRLTPSATDPVAYGHVGVTAHNDRDRASSVSAPAKVYRVHREPPATPPPFDITDTENVYATPADYHGHSYYQVPLPTQLGQGHGVHVLRALDDAVFKRDRILRATATRDTLSPNDNVIPQTWDPRDRQAVADTLNALDPLAPDAYDNLSNRALQVLASLPGNDVAFTQLTTQPVTASESTYRDTLNGRARNRYFYRIVYVDAGHNRSALGPSGPPIYLPNVTQPPAPQVAGHECTDGNITLTWTSLREPEFVTYEIYRTDKVSRARDSRLMELMHMEPMEAAQSPFERPEHLSWTDSNVHGGITYYYQLIAIDLDGNVSRPSQAYSVTAVDQRPPEPAVWIEAEWVVLRGPDETEEPWPQSGQLPPNSHPAVKLEWIGNVVGESHKLTKRARDEHIWQPVAIAAASPDSLRPPRHKAYDNDGHPHMTYTYRIQTIAATGVAGTTYTTIGVPRRPVVKADDDVSHSLLDPLP